MQHFFLPILRSQKDPGLQTHSAENEKPCSLESKKEFQTRKQRFGKSLIFLNMLDAETGYLIDT